MSAPASSDPGERLQPGAIEALIDTDHVTAATRRALTERLAWRAPRAPLCLDAEGLATLAAICERLIPQPDGERRVELAARLDASLAEGAGDGWRYDILPPDREAITRGVAGVDQSARLMFYAGFSALAAPEQDRVLTAVQDGSAPGDIWTGLASQRLFQELVAQVATLYFAHPFAQARIGYIGMADAQGFEALGLNRRDPIEDEASVAPL